MLTDELLWDYADGLLDGAEKIRVEAYLRQHPEQQRRFDAIMAEKRAFAGLPLEKPAAGFANQVLAAWAAEQATLKVAAPAKAKGHDWVLWAIAAAFGLLLIVPFLFSPATTAPEWSMNVPEEYVPQFQAPSFDWAGFLSSPLLRNALLLLLGFMSLKLLDKYLQVRQLRLAA